MKTIRLLFFFTMLLTATWSSAQSVSLYIGGSVTQTPSMQPYPFHMVKVTIGQDTSNPAQAITDSAFTSINGVYSMSVVVPWVPGTAVAFVVSTLDCQQYPHEQSYVYTGNSSQYGVNFSICGDSIITSTCSNYFDIAGSTGLSVSLWGHMVNQQAAVYSWEFSDGTSGGGEYVTHVFPSQGTYSVALTTFTADSCTDMTIQTITVYDTIPPLACDNYINIISTSGLTVTMNGGMVNQQSASYSWDFGDGSAGSGVFASHTYPTQGAYLITLTTLSADSCMDVTSQMVTVFDTINPLPCDNYITIAGTQGLSVSLNGGMVNQQSATYAWSFGDGATTTGSSVAHTYSVGGTYTITLSTLTADSCADVSSTTIILTDSVANNCNSYFTYLPGNNPNEIHFAGFTNSPYPTSFQYNFGDPVSGTNNTSNLQNAVHSYLLPGTYTVTLTTSDSTGCTNVYSSYVVITVYYCYSYFTYFPGNIPNEIHFAGFTNSPYPTSFLYNFGDPASGINNTSNLQNPVHTYLFAGNYTVMLTTSDSTGCTVVYYLNVMVTLLNCDNVITVTAIQGLTVSLQGGLINGITASCLWDLGDGSSATGNFVTHTYSALGTYTISLTTTSADSCMDVSTTAITLIDSTYNNCNSYFFAEAGNTLNEIHFEAYSTSPYPSTFVWDFGDPLSGINNTSTLQNPVHIFSAFGTYLVTLTTMDSANCSSQYAAPVSLSAFGFYNLYGQVFAANQVITACKVQLFDQDPDGNMNMIQEVMIDSGNFFNFNNVASGIYRMLAIPTPGTAYAQQYVPTYFGDAYLWENAVPLALGQAANPYNIHLVAFDSISGGSGLINGGLTNGGKSLSVGNQEILILDNTNTPVKYLFSKADGTFAFEGLPYGEYKVYPVITGITTHPVTVNLSETHSTATVIMTISGQSVAGFGDAVQLITDIYPNPAGSCISFSLKQKGTVKINIRDASGRSVMNQSLSAANSGQLITLPVTELKSGLYLLMIYDNEGNASSRLFVKN